MSFWLELEGKVTADIAEHDGEPGSQAKIAERLEVKGSAISITIRNLRKKGIVEVAEAGEFSEAQHLSAIDPAAAHGGPHR